MNVLILESTFDFKIIDFVFSGMKNELYPCLAMKNDDQFRSFALRQLFEKFYLKTS